MSLQDPPLLAQVDNDIASLGTAHADTNTHYSEATLPNSSCLFILVSTQL